MTSKRGCEGAVSTLWRWYGDTVANAQPADTRPRPVMSWPASLKSAHRTQAVNWYNTIGQVPEAAGRIASYVSVWAKLPLELQLTRCRAAGSSAGLRRRGAAGGCYPAWTCVCYLVNDCPGPGGGQSALSRFVTMS